MKANVGTADRLIRLVLGLVLLYEGLIKGQLWGYFGVIPFLTGAMGWCPLFRLFGFSTVGRSCSCSGTSCETDAQ